MVLRASFSYGLLCLLGSLTFFKVGGFDIKPIAISPAGLIGRRATVIGLASGNARDAEDTLNFAALRKIVPQIEVFPHADTAKAYDRMVRTLCCVVFLLVFLNCAVDVRPRSLPRCDQVLMQLLLRMNELLWDMCQVLC